MENLENNLNLPKYHKLKQVLRRNILKGKYQPGDIIPSENELQKKYQVSSTTVRRALSDLVHERLLVRGQGVGTFVNKPPVERSLWKIMSFTNNMLEKGYQPSIKVIEKLKIPCIDKVALELSINQGTQILFVKRLCFGDDIPMMFEHVYIREDLCPGIFEKDLSGSITKIIKEEYGHRITSIHQTLQFSQPDNLIKKYMNISDAGIPFFLVAGTQSIETGMTVIFERAYYRGDMYIFNINISE